MACRVRPLAVFLLALCVTFPAGSVGKKSTQSILLEKLLSEYGPSTIRPVYNISRKTTVIHRLLITQVIELNEKHQTIQISGWLRQTWEDEFLKWDPADYEEVDELYVHQSKVWLPDTTLYKNVDKDFESYKDISVQVFSSGEVRWATPVILKCTCLIDARLFPFDTQVCELKFSSWAFDGSEVDLVKEEGLEAGQVHFADNGVWQLLRVEVVRQEQWYACCPAPYPEVSYYLHLRRRPLFHVLNILVPCVLLSVLNLMVFSLPPESGEKIQLGMTNLLALVLFQQLISESLPPTSDKSPVIGFYFTPMIAIGCSSIVCTVLVLSLFYHDNSRPVPRWLRYVALKMATVVFYRVKVQPPPLDDRGGTSNPSYSLEGEVTGQRFQDSDSGVLTATCSFTDSSRSVNSEEAFGAGAADDGASLDAGQRKANMRCRATAYSMHFTQKVYSANGGEAAPANEAKETADTPQAKAEIACSGGNQTVDWKDVALIIDRGTMILSLIVTFAAMLITVLFFLLPNSHLE
ncbi:neuronal acetylcholine receptor subunit alpha-10-like [Acanthaster planci]|uniref:Neuronal acetylcholine receptor subunit alpha-10-like n=1 Tax=Acanthaster planci TaxID=133434 RepID=A0A8B7ZP57_ACAPL|nr:neuronal acetylcholine receptor subunit alpha-10-like [Acanthaster planci]